MSTETLTDWLLRQVADDEEVARAADVKQGDPAWKVCKVALSHPRGKRVRSDRDNRPIAYVEDVAGDDEDDTTGILDGEAAANHIARHDPARVLAECEALRGAIEAAWADHCRIEGEWGTCQGREQMSAKHDNPAVVEWLALPYADRPGYLAEWAPR